MISRLTDGSESEKDGASGCASQRLQTPPWRCCLSLVEPRGMDWGGLWATGVQDTLFSRLVLPSSPWEAF